MELEINSPMPDPHIWGFPPSPSGQTTNGSNLPISCRIKWKSILFYLPSPASATSFLCNLNLPLSLLFCLHAPSIILSSSKLGQQVTSPLNPSFPPPSLFSSSVHLQEVSVSLKPEPCLEKSAVHTLAWWPSVTSVGRTSCMHHFPACPSPLCNQLASSTFIIHLSLPEYQCSIFPYPSPEDVLSYIPSHSKQDSGARQGKNKFCGHKQDFQHFSWICQRQRSGKLQESTACPFDSRDNLSHTRIKVDRMTRIKQKDHCQGLN